MFSAIPTNQTEIDRVIVCSFADDQHYFVGYHEVRLRQFSYSTRASGWPSGANLEDKWLLIPTWMCLEPVVVS